MLNTITFSSNVKYTLKNHYPFLYLLIILTLFYLFLVAYYQSLSLPSWSQTHQSIIFDWLWSFLSIIFINIYCVLYGTVLLSHSQYLPQLIVTFNFKNKRIYGDRVQKQLEEKNK